MSAWQFKTYLVPTSSGIKCGDVVEEYRSNADGPKLLDDLSDLPNRWPDATILRQVAMAVSTFLPESQSWSTEARMFGNDESNWIEVWDTDVECRIDVRNYSTTFVEDVLGLARRFDCKLVEGGGGVVIEPDMHSITQVIASSRAFLFCADPGKFFATLKR